MAHDSEAYFPHFSLRLLSVLHSFTQSGLFHHSYLAALSAITVTLSLPQVYALSTLARIISRRGRNFCFATSIKMSHNRISSIDATLRSRRTSVDHGYSSLNSSLRASTSPIPASRNTLSKISVLAAFGLSVLLYLGWSQPDYSTRPLKKAMAFGQQHLCLSIK